MEEKHVTVKSLAEELGMTIANINIQILRGHAGEVTKSGEGETSEYLLTLENVNTLLKWLRANGRSNKFLLRATINKYKDATIN
ncbi:MAG: hypothetical protein LH629_14015 [Ignavibacteria bacterium]|nr:hypothetical protein [Ignavibacteria bacterium]